MPSCIPHGHVITRNFFRVQPRLLTLIDGCIPAYGLRVSLAWAWSEVELRSTQCWTAFNVAWKLKEFSLQFHQVCEIGYASDETYVIRLRCTKILMKFREWNFCFLWYEKKHHSVAGSAICMCSCFATTNIFRYQWKIYCVTIQMHHEVFTMKLTCVNTVSCGLFN